MQSQLKISSFFAAFIIPAGILVATGHVPCDMNYLGVIFLTLAVGFTGFSRSGHTTNSQDIASRYSKLSASNVLSCREHYSWLECI